MLRTKSVWNLLLVFVILTTVLGQVDQDADEQVNEQMDQYIIQGDNQGANQQVVIQNFEEDDEQEDQNPNDEQGDERLQEEENSGDGPIEVEELDESENESKNITVCDSTTTPRLSCQDCNTRLVCKPIGIGIVIPCKNPYKPHCNLGICSHFASPECA